MYVQIMFSYSRKYCIIFCTYMCVYICIHTERERERERELIQGPPSRGVLHMTISWLWALRACHISHWSLWVRAMHGRGLFCINRRNQHLTNLQSISYGMSIPREADHTEIAVGCSESFCENALCCLPFSCLETLMLADSGP